MRIAGLLTLALLFPVFAHAAEPLSLTAYTVSHDTIYPAAAAESGLATTTVIDIAFSEPVKVSIKVVSAGGTTMKSLYSSSSVTNPTPKTWDGLNTAGARVDDGVYTILISATSTATNLPMTDSSRTVTVASPSSSDSSDPESPPPASPATTPSSSGGPTEYLPIPVLHIVTAEDRIVSSGAEVAFTAVVYDSRGNRRDDALVTWSFGDGMRRTGASVFHAYYDPGEYLAVVRATTADGGDARGETVVTVKDARIKIASVSARGITLTNGDSRTLDLSRWRLLAGGKEFTIPEDTHLLAGHTVLLPTQVIELPVADSASLRYPSGEVAATYPETTRPTVSAPRAQLPARETSFNEVQTVEPAPSTNISGTAHEITAVGAPAAAMELAAAGAALPAAPTSSDSRLASLLRSPWTLGLLGVIAIAGGAFIFL